MIRELVIWFFPLVLVGFSAYLLSCIHIGFVRKKDVEKSRSSEDLATAIALPFVKEDVVDDAHPFVKAVLAKTKRRELPGRIISEGDPDHDHQFQMADWDRERLGSAFDCDEITKENIFTMATYRDFHRCSCGCEVVKSVRALL